MQDSLLGSRIMGVVQHVKAILEERFELETNNIPDAFIVPPPGGRDDVDEHLHNIVSPAELRSFMSFEEFAERRKALSGVGPSRRGIHAAP